MVFPELREPGGCRHPAGTIAVESEEPIPLPARLLWGNLFLSSPRQGRNIYSRSGSADPGPPIRIIDPGIITDPDSDNPAPSGAKYSSRMPTGCDRQYAGGFRAIRRESRPDRSRLAVFRSVRGVLSVGDPGSGNRAPSGVQYPWIGKPDIAADPGSHSACCPPCPPPRIISFRR